MMDARRLLHWGDLEERRRRQQRTGLGRLSPWVYCALAALALAFVVGRPLEVFGAGLAGDHDVKGAINLWLAALACGHVIVLLGAPFRMYWRHDSSLLGRTAIGGQALYGVALVRSLRAAAKMTLPCLAGALMIGVASVGSWELAGRHLAVVAMAFLWAGVFGPAVALAAGAVVASDQARAALSSLAGEFEPPRTSWLGVLPGLAGTLLCLLILDCIPWLRGLDRAPVGEPVYVLAIGFAVPVLCGLWAWSRADRVMTGAVREVSALDQERLAHIELTKPSALERAVSKRLGAEGARIVMDKDASLARRRYPIPFFFGVMGVITLWIVAATASEDLLSWTATVCAGLGVYGVVMARRYGQPPIEHMRFVRTLPITEQALVRAKRAHVLLWIASYMVAGALPCVLRATEPGTVALVVGAIVAVTGLAANAVIRDA